MFLTFSYFFFHLEGYKGIYFQERERERESKRWREREREYRIILEKKDIEIPRPNCPKKRSNFQIKKRVTYI